MGLDPNGQSPSIEEYVEARKGDGEGRPSLHRLLLPNSEAPKLLRLLSYEGITGASMFPGADGVVQEMREYALWDVRPQLRVATY
jgi:hypothetical protein